MFESNLKLHSMLEIEISSHFFYLMLFQQIKHLITEVILVF